MKTLKLTDAQAQELRFIVRSMVGWESGGCYGDGEEVTDKAGFNRARQILKKLETL